MMDDRTPGYDEPDRAELTRDISLQEWDYKWDRGGGERLTHKWRSAS